MARPATLLLYITVTLTLFSCAHKNQQKTHLNDYPLNLAVKKVTLSNGLRVLIHENHKLPIFSYYTFFDVGGRYEKPGTTGASHFLEHLMFKGAKKYGAGKFDTIIEGNGGSTNAYTTVDSTVYYENLPTKNLDIIIDMEADRMVNLLLDPVAFEKEREVVLEERKFRYENSPRGKLYQQMMRAVFAKTPYGGSVIGDVADLKSLSRDQVMQYFKKFYAPNNAIIVIVGDVDADETIMKIEKKFGALPASTAMLALKKELDQPQLYRHQGVYKREIKSYGTSPTPIFMLAYKGEPLGTYKSFVMDMLSSILGDGQSSYLTQKYIKGKRPLLNNINVANYNLKYSGVFFLSGELLAKTNYKRFKKNLLRETRKMCKTAITERTLQKTKNQYLIGYYRDIQSNAGVARFLGMRENFYNDYSYYKKELDIYNKITVQEVKDVCHEIFDKQEYILVSLWDKYKKKK